MADSYYSELATFINHSDPRVRIEALKIVAQLCTSDETNQIFLKIPHFTQSLTNEVEKDVSTKGNNDQALEQTLTILTNVGATDSAATAILSNSTNNFIPSLIKIIAKKDSKHADLAAGLLVNLTRPSGCCKRVYNSLKSNAAALSLLLEAATGTSHNTVGCNLNYLMHVLENLSQIPDFIQVLLDKKTMIIKKIVPFVKFEGSTIRRRATAAVFVNLCFSKENHLWLISPDVDLASYLLVPLLGGRDEFREDEIEALSDLLLFPDEDKMREPEAEIRLLLLQAIYQLCATRAAREELRRQSIYSVLREYHKWEKDLKCLNLLDDLINILIKTEDEIGQEDLTLLDVPTDLQEKFNQLDIEATEEQSSEK